MPPLVVSFASGSIGPLRSAVWIALLTGVLLVLSGCSTPPEQLTVSDSALPEIIQDGIPVPRFSTASDQLSYARSGLTDKKRKLAALRAVPSLFPGSRLECAQAAVGLAYLHLEPEYRFASQLEIQQAANDFQAVLDEFGDIPGIRAKSLWYLGWIHTELKQDPDTGLAFYWQVARRLSFVPMNLTPTAPWVNLVYAAEPAEKALKPAAPTKYWAQVALLEIVRNARDSAQAKTAFDLLMARYTTSQAAGLALKHMLAEPALADHALPAVDAYLAANSRNPYLARDIRTLAEGAAP
jgi:hypothetical protein